LASFDRRKCKVLAGPAATTGQHCPEGRSIPCLARGSKAWSARSRRNFQYYNFVDRFNTLGLSEHLPLANGTMSDSILALRPDGTFLVLRVPIPNI
jgi:hypothetical protein